MKTMKWKLTHIRNHKEIIKNRLPKLQVLKMVEMEIFEKKVQHLSSIHVNFTHGDHDHKFLCS